MKHKSFPYGWGRIAGSNDGRWGFRPAQGLPLPLVMAGRTVALASCLPIEPITTDCFTGATETFESAADSDRRPVRGSGTPTGGTIEPAARLDSLTSPELGSS